MHVKASRRVERSSIGGGSKPIKGTINYQFEKFRLLAGVIS